MTTKEKYIQFAATQDRLPLFIQPWWLEAAMNGEGNWDAALVEINGKIKAALPYCFKKRFGITNIFIPWCTAYISTYPSDTHSFPELIYQLPNAADYRFRLFPTTSPSFWVENGYSIKKTNTHLIEQKSLETFSKNISASTLRQIKKAEKTISVSMSDNPMPAYKLWKSNMMRKKAEHALIPEKNMLSIDCALATRKQRQIWEARDQQGILHAAIYIAEDLNHSYYLWGGYDAKHRASGANSLLFYNAIISAIEQGKIFDFEGSMVKSVAKFYKGFGAEEIDVFSAHKTPSLLGKIIKRGQ